MATSTAPGITRLAIVGAGGMARHHLKSIVKMRNVLEITAICEPSGDNYEKAAEIFEEAGLPVPPCEPDFEKFVKKHRKNFDAAFVITPHNQHVSQASALLAAKKDVLLEKPMVLNTKEARALMAAQKASGCLLDVAFNGSHSPAIRKSVDMLRAGELGKILSVAAAVWQNWQSNTTGTWRQVPKISGGGFLFDTGAHLLNTVSDLVGEGFSRVSAIMDNCGSAVDIQSVIAAQTKSGIKISMNATGNACFINSDIKVICEKGLLVTGIWGERLLLQREGETELKPVELPASLGVVESFLKVRRGEMPNPCPPEIGLRMIQLWDAARKSAKNGGVMVDLK